MQTVRPQGAKLAFLVLRQNKQGYVATIQADHAPRSLSPQTEQPFARTPQGATEMIPHGRARFAQVISQEVAVRAERRHRATSMPRVLRGACCRRSPSARR